MDDNLAREPDRESDVPQGEVIVEMASGAPWEWQEVRPVYRKRRWKVPLALFLATCATTWLTGGLRYAVPVMTILLCHEMGHFIQAWRYGVYASLPFFIPIPPGLSPIGTMGAVIAMEPRMGHRRALFDIGISGPLAGLVPTMIFLIVGLQHSQPVPHVQGVGLVFGDPLLFQYLAEWILGPVPQGYLVLTDPMAFAGWVGLLVTSLNLMPIGQLDGGHILYALLRRNANRFSRLLLIVAIALVVFNFEMLRSWLLMLFLLILMGPNHPPTANDDEPLGTFRTVLGWLMLAFIFIGFTPTPIVP